MWTKNNIPDQSGKTAIVTGANTGIGFETALALYEAGAHVILACRSNENAEQAIARIQSQSGKGSLEARSLNLANLSAVQQFATDFLKDHQALHYLINNAGVMIPPASKTDDGFELQFGVNFLGHFALTGYLYPLLNATPGSRIVTVSSMAYIRVQTIDFDNLRSEKDYDAFREYAQSKLADILFSRELQRRIVATNGRTASVAAQPGANKTDLSRHMSQADYSAAVERIGGLMEPWQGALPSLYAAVSDEVVAGELYGPDGEGGYLGYPAHSPYLPHALNDTLAKQLFDYAETVTGVHFPE